MEKRTCFNCGKDYAIVPDDSLRAYNKSSPWLDDVCKRCTCLLRRYHSWTITDQGARICGYCFIRRYPLGRLVERLVHKRLELRKRELAHKKVHKGNESP